LPIGVPLSLGVIFTTITVLLFSDSRGLPATSLRPAAGQPGLQRLLFRKASTGDGAPGPFLEMSQTAGVGLGERGRPWCGADRLDRNDN
jgi:hypothetical protein